MGHYAGLADFGVTSSKTSNDVAGKQFLSTMKPLGLASTMVHFQLAVECIIAISSSLITLKQNLVFMQWNQYSVRRYRLGFEDGAPLASFME